MATALREAGSKWPMSPDVNPDPAIWRTEAPEPLTPGRRFWELPLSTAPPGDWLHYFRQADSERASTRKPSTVQIHKATLTFDIIGTGTVDEWTAHIDSWIQS